MKSFSSLPRDAWQLAKPFFFDPKKRWAARGLLAAILALNLAQVGMTVILSYWRRAFYNSLQDKDWDSFISLLLTYKHTESGFMPGFVGVATVFIIVLVYARYLNQWLQIMWREWMTSHMLHDWLSDRAYYRISLTAGSGEAEGTDNPDQRISEDLRDFVEQTLSLSIGFLSNLVSLFSFVTILWTLSGPLTVLRVEIPGYLVWIALLYAAFGTIAAHLVGRPLAALNFKQQRVEADFRFSMVRVREHTEAVALSGGEAQERRWLYREFQAVRANWWAIMKRNKLLNFMVVGYDQASAVFPYIVVSPGYFFGKLDLGGLTQTASAFLSVHDALSWFVSSYSDLAKWRAIVTRLTTFQEAIDAARATGREGLATAAGGEDYGLEGATLRLPDRRVLVEGANLTLRPRESVVITGRSGSGKSTLFRALSGIWPFASGTLRPSDGTSMFLPQRPYFPLGRLRDAIAYPSDTARFSDAALNEALIDVGLPALLGRLDDIDNWGQRLSGGEQQRLSLARALLTRPDWLFLDEATASLDPQSEMELHAMLKARLPGTTIVSIAHREAVAALHDRRIEMDRDEGAPARLHEAAPALAK